MSRASLFTAMLVLGIVVGYSLAWLIYQPKLEEERSRSQELEARISMLEEELENARVELASKEATIEELQSKLEEAKRNVSNLLTELDQANSVIEELESEKNNLIQKLAQANSTIEVLESNLSLLEGRLFEIEGELNYTKMILDNLNSSVYEAASWYGLLDQWIYDYMLDLALASLDEEIVDEAVQGYRVEDRLYSLMEWMMWNVEYDYDAYVRVVDPYDYSVRIWPEYLLLPNETLSRGGGDCDDLALLAYSILEASGIPWQKLYLITWYPAEGPGHVAVLAELGGKYYIIDPAGNWLNGVSLYIMVKILDEEDPNYYWKVYLDPLNLDKDEKLFLSENGFASMVYYVPMTDTVYESRPQLAEYTDVLELLDEWIRGYWQVEPAWIEIIGENVYEEFTSVESAAYWIDNNG